MKRLKFEQGSPEWHTWRSSIIGGSDAPSVMGIGFMTPYQLYMNKLGLYEVPLNPYMMRGNKLEPVARERFIDEKGLFIEPACVQSSEYSFLGASLDGIDKSESFIVEIKTGGAEALEMAKAGIVSPKNYCQEQHNLKTTGLDKCIHVFYDDKENKNYYIDVYRDTKYINRLIEAEKAFWGDLVNFVPPTLSEKDYIEKDGEWVEIAAELVPLMKNQKKLDLIIQQKRDRLIELTEGKNSQGGGIKLARIPRMGMIDYSKIEVLKNLNLDEYRKPSSVTWRLTTK